MDRFHVVLAVCLAVQGISSLMTTIVIVALSARSERRHEAALAEMRLQLRVYEAVCRRGGDAEHVFVRPRESTSESWVDLVLAVPGLSLRYPIRPEQMDLFVALLRGENHPGLPPFLPDGG